VGFLCLRGSIAWQSVFLCVAISQGLEIAASLKCAADFSESIVALRLTQAAQVLLVVAIAGSLVIGAIELAVRIRRDAFHWFGNASGLAPVMHTLVFRSPLPDMFQQ
jgi:hypothetical protein